jgi:hypothetical protein
MDSNRDGLTDRLEMNLLLPLQSSEKLLSINALSVFDVKISNKAKYMFQSATLMSYESSRPLKNVFIEGDIMIRQQMSLYTKGGCVTAVSC